tara:strand:- start:441 stop:1202 length:762 start_codon:yes stop_codon:yes gene_type:complete
MKIALCLSGYVGAMKKFHEGEELNIDINEGFSYIRENIIRDYDVDTFVFSFDIDRKQEILNTYKPTSFRIEEQIKKFKIDHTQYSGKKPNGHSIPKYIFSTQSQHYSRKKVIELKTKHEKENNFKYDWVIIARMDMGYFKPFVFEDKDPNRLYLAGPHMQNRVNDIFMFSGSKIMDKVGEFYDDLQNCYLVETLHAHIALANYFKRCGLWKKIHYYQNRPWGDPRWKPGDIGLLRLKPNVKTITINKGDRNEK